MNVAEACIRRPVMTVLIMLGILLFGFFAYRLMPVSDLPNVDFPTIQVSASLAGASPETMASSVALPLEKQFSTIAGIDSMTSTSGIGTTSITIQFDLDRDIDAAAQDVQSAISQTLRQLPRDMPNPPSYRKVNPADSPVLMLALTSPTLPLSLLDEHAETNIAQRISMVSGVAQVQVYGAQKYAVRIQLNPDLMASRGIGIDEVSNAVKNANVNLPSGVLYGKDQAYTVQVDGQLPQSSAYEPVVVAWRNGAPVRLGDLGKAVDSVENDKVAAWFTKHGRAERSIVLAIQRQPGTNTVEVVKNIRKLLGEFRAQLPAAASLNVMYDRSESIQESVNDVQFTLLLTLGLVILVIFLFLRKVTATLIPSLALPFSLVGTFAVMHLMGFSIDNLSLMAITLSVGFVVDDAIVMLENIVRHLEQGKTPWRAAVDGSREIGFTIISMTLSLAAVFIPILFMGGIVGRLFHEFAVTIATSILVSGLVSLSLTPMMASRFLRPHGQKEPGRLYRASEAVFDGMLRLYDLTLRPVLRFRFLTLLLSFAIIGWTAWLFMRIPKGFLPSEDTGRLQVTTEAAQGVGFNSMVNHQKALAALLANHPGIESFMSSVGGRGGGSAATNTGSLFLKLLPRSQRAKNSDEILTELRPKLSRIPGIQAFIQNPPSIRIGGQQSKSLYQFTLQSTSFEDLYNAAPALESRLKNIPGLMDVTSDLLIRNPELQLDLNRDRASALGVSAYSLEDALFSAYGSRQISTIYAPNNQYNIILEMLPRFQQDPSAISRLYVRAGNGSAVPLPVLTKAKTGLGPLSVNHVGQLPAVTLSFNLAPGVSLGDAVSSVEKEARESLPQGISTQFLGTAQAFQSSLQGMGMLLLAALLVIYIVLGILYESFWHPITILSGLPSAGLGALLTLQLFKVDLNLYAMVGVIMLIGIVKKNAIMMIDFAIVAERAGKGPAEAIHEACLVRFRPIMMTTMAALMGTLPIALGYGAGAEARRPLGLTVVGGLLVSQFITLYLTPVIYIYMDRLQRTVRRMRGAPEIPGASDAELEAEA